MILTGSKMALWAPLPVWLVCGLITVSESATATDAADGYRKICPATEHDIRENHLHQGAELSCCGHQAFHPSTATCCKVGNEHNLTNGLSQMVSSCCGLKAYDSRNELCCEAAVVVKSSPNATCCGKKAMDKNNEMCCGPAHTVLWKVSPHHKCCGEDQYNTMTEHCCEKNNALKICPISSRCCENESVPFDDNEQMRCGRNHKMVKKLSPHHKCCGEDQYDPRTECCREIDDALVKCNISSRCCDKESVPLDDNEQMRCGRNHKMVKKLSPHHKCCGEDQYDPRTECCCEIDDALVKCNISSRCCDKESVPLDDNEQMRCGRNHKMVKKLSPHHKCCGEDQYDPRTECCCEIDDALVKCNISSRCCDKESVPFDDNEQMRCGRNHKMVKKLSPHHKCCGEDQYDPRTECCCEIDDALVKCNISSRCCDKESGVRQQEPGSPPICTEPQTRHQRETKSLPGQCDAVPTVYRPHTHVCCDGRVSEWNQSTDQPHGSLGQHCCGTEVYWPYTQICCNGHRHPKRANMHCCGTKAYNIKNKQMKCCAGTLYNLTQSGQLRHEVRCCGNVLQTTQDVCCTSEEKELHYSAKTGFECCGHLYYDTSLRSCCSEHQPGHHHHTTVKGTRLQSLGHLDETKLCEQMLIGTVESVSPMSILFGNVLKICGRNGTVRSLPSPYIRRTHDHCNFPKLSPGKTYLFDENDIYSNSYHSSTLQLLHFIFSKCNY